MDGYDIKHQRHSNGEFTDTLWYSINIITILNLQHSSHHLYTHKKADQLNSFLFEIECFTFSGFEMLSVFLQLISLSSLFHIFNPDNGFLGFRENRKKNTHFPCAKKWFLTKCHWLEAKADFFASKERIFFFHIEEVQFQTIWKHPIEIW